MDLPAEGNFHWAKTLSFEDIGAIVQTDFLASVFFRSLQAFDYQRAHRTLQRIEHLEKQRGEDTALSQRLSTHFPDEIRLALEVAPSLPTRRPGGKKICYFLHNSMPYASGGYATRAHGLAKALSSIGYEVHAITRPGFPLDERSDVSARDLASEIVLDAVPATDQRRQAKAWVAQDDRGEYSAGIGHDLAAGRVCLTAWPMRRWAKRWRVTRRAVSRGLSLSARFLIVAAVTVTIASILLGFLVTRFLESGVLDGVARTASASIEALIYPSVSDLSFDPDLDPDELQRLNEIIALRREAESTRLLQFELRRPTGELVYRADGGLVDDTDEGLLASLTSDSLLASVRDVRLETAGPFPQFRLAVIRIVTPLTRPEESGPFVIAIMYFSAQALLDIESRIAAYVWAAVAVIGFGVIVALFANVNRTSQLIAGQRSMLARSAAEWRRLARENSRLHMASEQLRLDASSANESLLVRVGSDIHDGPVQVLALLVLKLSDTDMPSGELDEYTSLAQEAMEELRNISAGLVLPELASLSLAETIRLAVARHERSFGTSVTTAIDPLPEKVSMAIRTCAYRVAQEGLNNGFRHGSKGSQRVEATAADGRLELSISNQNRHSAASALSASADRIGLIGMRLRVEALGGNMSVELGEMTFLRVSIPIVSPVLLGRKAH